MRGASNALLLPSRELRLHQLSVPSRVRLATSSPPAWPCDRPRIAAANLVWQYIGNVHSMLGVQL